MPNLIPEDLLDIVGELIAYEDQKRITVEEIEDGLERAYAELEIEYSKLPKEEEDFDIDFSLF